MAGPRSSSSSGSVVICFLRRAQRGEHGHRVFRRIVLQQQQLEMAGDHGGIHLHPHGRYPGMQRLRAMIGGMILRRRRLDAGRSSGSRASAMSTPSPGSSARRCWIRFNAPNAGSVVHLQIVAAARASCSSSVRCVPRCRDRRARHRPRFTLRGSRIEHTLDNGLIHFLEGAMLLIEIIAGAIANAMTANIIDRRMLRRAQQHACACCNASRVCKEIKLKAPGPRPAMRICRIVRALFLVGRLS